MSGMPGLESYLAEDGASAQAASARILRVLPQLPIDLVNRIRFGFMEGIG